MSWMLSMIERVGLQWACLKQSALSGFRPFPVKEHNIVAIENESSPLGIVATGFMFGMYSSQVSLKILQSLN